MVKGRLVEGLLQDIWCMTGQRHLNDHWVCLGLGPVNLLIWTMFGECRFRFFLFCFCFFCIRPTPNTKMSVTETYRPIWNFNFLVRVRISRMIRDKAAYHDCSLTSEFARVIKE